MQLGLGVPGLSPCRLAPGRTPFCPVRSTALPQYQHTSHAQAAPNVLHTATCTAQSAKAVSDLGHLRRTNCRRLGIVAAAGDGGGGVEKNSDLERAKLIGSLVAIATVVAAVLTWGSDGVQELIYGDGLDGLDGSIGSGGPSPGDIVGSALWGSSLYFCSPLQLLLLFIGDIDTERPSDWLLRIFGSATGQPVTNPQYSAPVALRAAVVAACAFGGAAIAWAFEAGLGDATWSVSTGLGACMASAVYEVGRPARLSKDQADEVDDQWRTFAAFAMERLQRSGGCHESEVAEAFRKTVPRLRSTDAMPDTRVRDFVRAWHPDVRITPNGYWKGLSMKKRTDPFTGQAVGAEAPVTAGTSSVIAESGSTEGL